MPWFINGDVMRVIVRYLNHCRRYANTNIRFSNIPIDLFMELILAADYLDLTYKINIKIANNSRLLC